MKLKFTYFALLIFGVLTIASCGKRSDNQKLKEAAAIRNSFMAQYDSVYQALQVQEKKVDAMIAATSTENEKYLAYQSMKRGITKGFGLLKSWENGLTPIPGLEDSETGLAPHSENEEKEKDARSFSDEEILTLQQAYRVRLQEVTKEVNQLLETIKMYEESAK